MPYINTYTLIINKLLLKAKEVTNKKLIAYIGVKNLEFFVCLELYRYSFLSSGLLVHLLYLQCVQQLLYLTCCKISF